MSFILNILICVDMILLDSLLQCFMFIIVIHLSSIFDIVVVSICNLLFMFIIYFWIKIKLKVLIFLTIQKSYSSHFVDALRPTLFTGVHFKRWQSRVTLWLPAMGVFWLSNGCLPWVYFDYPMASLRVNSLLSKRRNMRKSTQSLSV
jgi:hypothetical protein